MGSYVPSTREERREMLRAIGLEDYRDLYKDVPQEMYLDRPLDLPEGMSELEVSRAMREIAGKKYRMLTLLSIGTLYRYVKANKGFARTRYTSYKAN